jgi:hypothetical protein
MAIQFKYTPPKVDARPLMAAATKAAEHAGAVRLLELASTGVPVETGRLRDSGKVTDTADGAVVGYGFEDGEGQNAPTAAYAIKQHEDPELDHPNGGGMKWLEIAQHSGNAEITAVLAVELKKVFG